jgi:hypothetical protein
MILISVTTLLLIIVLSMLLGMLGLSLLAARLLNSHR